jgi:hypothetical protein
MAKKTISSSNERSLLGKRLSKWRTRRVYSSRKHGKRREKHPCKHKYIKNITTE